MISVSLNKHIEVTNTSGKKLELGIVDRSTSKIIYADIDLEVATMNVSYFVDLMFLVKDKATGAETLMEAPKLKTVVIEIHSKALGDQIAWVPIIDLFRIKHNCKVIVRCYNEMLFKQQYKNIIFKHQYFTGDVIPKDDSVFKASAVYVLGYSVSGTKHPVDGSTMSPVDCRTVGLQQVGCHQLGMPLDEVRPSFTSIRKKQIIKGKYVVITTCGTAKLKLWNNPKGFVGLVKYFKSKGYQVVDVGDSSDHIEGTISKNGILAWNELINILQHADLFVSGSNGLQWLAFASMDSNKIVSIGGILEEWGIFKHHQVRNQSVCGGCWNSTEHIFENDNFNYCPRNENFICSSSITPEMVINEIEKVL